jgi:hypothetical protein
VRPARIRCGLLIVSWRESFQTTPFRQARAELPSQVRAIRSSFEFRNSDDAGSSVRGPPLEARHCHAVAPIVID